MWHKVATGILRNRLAILILIGITTIFMAYNATKVELQYEFGKLLPKKDSTNIEYLKFRDAFGQDGLVIVIATETKDFYTLDKFDKWYELGNRLKAMEVDIVGANPPQKAHPIDSIFSEAHLYNIIKNKEQKKFTLEPLLKSKPTSQKQVDSINQVVHNLPFYENMVYKNSSDIHMMMIFVNEKVFNSKSRGHFVEDIHDICEEYKSDFGTIHYSGLPYVRSITMNKVKSELGLFVGLTILVTISILFFFYRSFKVVITALIVVSIGVIWSIGSIYLFGFKISVLMGLMPPLIIVIGIPNCIYLITKYQQEFLIHGNKAKALIRVIRKVGNATFLTNATTSIGFATFLLTESSLMREFGLVAAVNIIALFLISILIVPIVYSYFTPPKEKHIKHFDKKWLDWATEGLLNISANHRKLVYIISLGVVATGLFGMSLMRTSGNIVDDLPKGDQVVKDLKYFEKEFNGVMPFEVLITAKDTIYKNKSLPNYRNFKIIDNIQTLLAKETKLSRSISMVDAIKYVSQAYSGGNKDKYVLKSFDGLIDMMGSNYFKNTFNASDKEKSGQLLSGFLDSTQRSTRITIQIQDIGIDSMNAVLSRVKNDIESVINAEQILLDSILLDQNKIPDNLALLYSKYPWILAAMEDSLIHQGKAEEFDFLMDEELIKSFHSDNSYIAMLGKTIEQEKLTYTVTGSGVIYTKGTTYLVKNLFISLLAAVIVIGFLMAFLFRSWRMVLVSLIPNLLPLIFTSGLMGYLGVPIKPSTILVFSIALGISIDDTIHFLAKYRQELKLQKWNIKGSVINSIKETAVSMIYTSIILFFGFIVFIFSNFGGTQALGILVSITLFIAMLSNLILLPSLLLTLEKYVTTKAFKDPMLEVIDEEEDIELDKLEINKEA